VEASGVSANFTKTMTKIMLTRFTGVTLSDPKNKRLFDKLSKIGDAALTAEKFEELSRLKAGMEATYSTAKVCKDRTVTDISLCKETDRMSLEPELTKILDESRDYDELLYVWKTWRDVSGKHMRGDYIKYISLKNQGAEANGNNYSFFFVI
jgi:peptidyl-dipeptidase A